MQLLHVMWNQNLTGVGHSERTEMKVLHLYTVFINFLSHLEKFKINWQPNSLMQNDLNYGRRPKLRWSNVVNVDLTKKSILITMITDKPKWKDGINPRRKDTTKCNWKEYKRSVGVWVSENYMGNLMVHVDNLQYSEMQ